MNDKDKTERAAIQPAGDETKFRDLLVDACNASFDCGEWDDNQEDEQDEYKGLVAVAKAKREAVVNFYLAAPISEGSASEAPQLTRSSFQTDSGYNVYVKELAQWWLKAATQQEAKADQADDQCHDCGKFVGHADWCSTSMYRNSDGTPIPAKPSSEASAGELPPWPDYGIVIGDVRGFTGEQLNAFIAADRAARTPAIVGGIAEDMKLRDLMAEFHAQPQNSYEEEAAENAVYAYLDTIIQGVSK